MPVIAAKFGGTSLADASAWQRVRAILEMDRQRRYIVLSAPGKRAAGDEKITDLLYRCHDLAKAGSSIGSVFERIRARYLGIAEALDIVCGLEVWLEEVAAAIQGGASSAYAASRGEYLCARLFSAYMDLPFIDAALGVRFDSEGDPDHEATYAALAEALAPYPRAVIPGFYGSDPGGGIRTFSRGGSDITGALVACALNADLYENWTDVTGFRSADPRIVEDAGFITHMTYRELRELSYMGASVLHEDAVFPVRQAGIATSLRNTFDPLHPGTTIHYSASRNGKQNLVTGIAGQKGYTLISLEKDRMNVELGFGRKVLQVFETFGINFEHLPTGIDTLCVVVQAESFQPRREEIIAGLMDAVAPDIITVDDHLAMIATVGAGMKNHFGIAARLFTSLVEQGINIKTISQVPSEISIIVGIKEEDLDRGIRAIYDAFLRV
ncbi:MAG: aspartate kinase [Christensenellales bacterium]